MVGKTARKTGVGGRMGSDGSYGYGLGGGRGVDSVDWWQALVSLVMDPGVLAPRSYLVHFAELQALFRL